jgi:multifunctional 2-oxoglutarate metabolism enzyme
MTNNFQRIDSSGEEQGTEKDVVLHGDPVEAITANFGYNAAFVLSLFSEYQSNPSAVDLEWRNYFQSLTGNGDGTATVAYVQPEERAGRVEPQTNRSINQQTGEQTEVRPSAATSVPLALPSGVSASAPRADVATTSESITLRGAARKLIENMEASLTVPTATSQRQIPLKVLEENRTLINEYRLAYKRSKLSYTHLIAWAIVKALEKFPQLNDTFSVINGDPHRIKRPEVNLGLAVDIERPDGSRSLLVPNIKSANRMNFSEFFEAYNEVVRGARSGKLPVAAYQDTTITLTNPGTIGTTASNARLMAGQGLIIATGSIDYPAEYHGMASDALAQLGISKVTTLSSTYDHRIVQGAESGSLLAEIHSLLLGEDSFYDRVYSDLEIPYKPVRWAIDHNPTLLGGSHDREVIEKQARVLELINAYRVRGHLIADIDPLNMPRRSHPELEIESYGLTIWDLDREFITGGMGGAQSAPLRGILAMLRVAYCGKVGIEYRHIQDPREKAWIRDRVEEPVGLPPAEVRKQILWKLISAETFERFLHTKYLGQKRFSVEGGETIVALLDQLIEGAAKRGIEDITIGMSHRGRLNVLANVVGRFCERIFTIFEGSIHPDFPHDQGDVKYHQGAAGQRETSGRDVTITVAPNPSHLEFVDPVVEGMIRAKMDRMGRDSLKRALPVLIHGDAAFSGEGIVAETLNLAQLEGYRTGGTIHIVINNQIGFTTSPEDSRSSVYSTDVARMTQTPIFHVNGDDPDTAYKVLQIALDYRQEFHKDVVIDLIGFRRHGHNEADEPTYTHPLLYHRVRQHQGVRALYVQRLIKEKVIDEAGVEALMKQRVERYEAALMGAKEIVKRQPSEGIEIALRARATVDEISIETVATGVARETLQMISRSLTTVPEGFHANPKLVPMLNRRASMGAGEVPLDWSFAELLAFGSLAVEGIPVRLSGQDSGRGTFSQRHAIFYDNETGEPWIPLSHIAPDQARADVYDSLLSEAGVLGFEYGYSIAAPGALVLWEAQFGDFVNTAQVIIDQFIVSGEEKWNHLSRLVLLLPHGYEGQGPEHSSARPERFLQLCAKNNIQVVQCSTPAQYFHLLRRQMKQKASKPLVVFTPKSLLRLPAASSSLDELVNGHFQTVIDDTEAGDDRNTSCVIFCSGKIYYELLRARKNPDVRIVRLEQFYPFPYEVLGVCIERYSKARDWVWVQEEPQNMGAWCFLEPRFSKILPKGKKLHYIGRPASASTATGFSTIHQMEQQQIINEAFADMQPAEAKNLKELKTKAIKSKIESQEDA